MKTVLKFIKDQRMLPHDDSLCFKVPSIILYPSYLEYCEEESLVPVSHSIFKSQFLTAGFRLEKTIHNLTIIHFRF